MAGKRLENKQRKIIHPLKRGFEVQGEYTCNYIHLPTYIYILYDYTLIHTHASVCLCATLHVDLQLYVDNDRETCRIPARVLESRQRNIDFINVKIFSSNGDMKGVFEGAY